MRPPTCLLVLSLLATAVFAAPARGDGGPSPGVSFGDTGLADSHGTGYATQLSGKVSFLVVRDGTGRVLRSRTFKDVYGLPRVTYGTALGGLSRDGRTLVLARTPQGVGLASTSRLLVLDTRTLRTRRRIDLTGDLSFDALSPDAGTLFLIQHTSVRDYARYRVRAYDLLHGRLLPNAIVDKTEPNMRGYPAVRLVGPGGTWIYTLYMHQGGEPFVHALDTVHARARCLDIHWQGNQDVIWTARLKLRGDRLSVLTQGGEPIAELELQPPKTSGFPVGWVTAVVAVGILGAAILCNRLLQTSTRPGRPLLDRNAARFQRFRGLSSK